MNVFLDTMVYLHCVPVDEIDFLGLLRTPSVTIFVPRITLKELDKHKSTHESSRIRDRARKALIFLEERIELGSPARNGIIIQFIPNMPRVDMEAFGLDAAWNDDLLIASILEQKERMPSVDTVLVSHDTAARLTCRTLGIRTLQLPDKYRLPRELDEAERENQRLRNELQKLRSALPRIAVGFLDSKTASARFIVRPPQDISDNEIAEALANLQAAMPKATKTPLETAGNHLPIHELFKNMYTLAHAPDSEIDRYNEERERYVAQYGQFLRKKEDFENLRKRCIRFTIAISNSGSAPAEDVDVRFHFPDGFTLMTSDRLPPTPEEPIRPTPPQNPFERISQNAFVPDLSSFKFDVPQVRPITHFKLRKTNSYQITDHFRRIKHGIMQSLPELALIYDAYNDAQSFGCDYEINVGNLPECLRGTLHFVIDKVD